MTVATETLPAFAAREPRPLHPLVHAGRWLAADLFSTLAFAGLIAVTHNAMLSTGVAIVAGIGQIAWLKARGRPVDLMQWMSLGLVIVFGGATLLTHDPRFVFFKPTLIYCAIGATMLRPGWMTRYMTPIVLEHGRDIIGVFGFVWAGLMFATAAANAALALHGDAKLWVWFIGVVPLASKLGLFAVQYLATRVILQRRVRTDERAVGHAGFTQG